MKTTQQFISSYEKPSKAGRLLKRISISTTLKECLFDLSALRFRHLVATVLITLAVVLPTAGYLFANVFDQIGDNLSRARAISVFIQNQPQRSLQELTQTLSQYGQIERAELVPLSLETSLPGAGNTRLVEVIPVAGLSRAEFSLLVDQLGALTGVELVSSSTATLERNHQASRFAQGLEITAYGVAISLLMLVVWWLIRQSIRASKKAIQIKHQLGATPLQIRRPLLFRGMLLGTLAGFAGYLTTTSLLPKLPELVDITIFKFDQQPDVIQIFLYFFSVLVLSYITTRLAFRKEFSKLNQAHSN